MSGAVAGYEFKNQCFDGVGYFNHPIFFLEKHGSSPLQSPQQ